LPLGEDFVGSIGGEAQLDEVFTVGSSANWFEGDQRTLRGSLPDDTAVFVLRQRFSRQRLRDWLRTYFPDEYAASARVELARDATVEYQSRSREVRSSPVVVPGRSGFGPRRSAIGTTADLLIPADAQIGERSTWWTTNGQDTGNQGITIRERPQEGNQRVYYADSTLMGSGKADGTRAWGELHLRIEYRVPVSVPQGNETRDLGIVRIANGAARVALGAAATSVTSLAISISGLDGAPVDSITHSGSLSPGQRLQSQNAGFEAIVQGDDVLILERPRGPRRER
jgi:hypothetical protein